MVWDGMDGGGGGGGWYYGQSTTEGWIHEYINSKKHLACIRWCGTQPFVSVY